MRFSKSLYRPLLIGLLVVAIALRLYSYTFNSNITGFFQIGSVIPLSPYLDQATTKTFPNTGYDGQFFLTLALDPWLQNDGSIVALDAPVYRYRRILYPLLGHLLGLGNPEWIPYALVGINVCCGILLAGAIGQQQRDNWRALAVLSLPGLWLVLSLSTADLLSALLAVVAITTYQNRQPGRTAIALSLACLTRETMVVQWGAIALASLLDRRGQEFKSLLWALPLPIAWNLYVGVRANHWSKGTGFQDNFVFPFTGIAQKFVLVIQRGWQIGNVFEGIAFLGLLLALAATLLLAWRYRHENAVILTSAGLSGGLLMVSGLSILEYAEGYNRVYLPIYCLLLLVRPPGTLQIPVPIVALSFSGIATGKFLLDLLV